MNAFVFARMQVFLHAYIYEFMYVCIHTRTDTCTYVYT